MAASGAKIKAAQTTHDKIKTMELAIKMPEEKVIEAAVALLWEKEGIVCGNTLNA